MSVCLGLGHLAKGLLLASSIVNLLFFPFIILKTFLGGDTLRLCKHPISLKLLAVSFSILLLKLACSDYYWNVQMVLFYFSLSFCMY